jgi:hypothetical protein
MTRSRPSIPILFLALWLASPVIAVHGQTLTVEADPDVYYDRGITFSVGAKPADTSRWTVLGDFASRKVGPLSHDERLEWRVGAGGRYRLFGQRNNLFGQLNLSVDQLRAKTETTRGLSLRPGVGAQWFPWTTKGFYVTPLLTLDHPPGLKNAHPRGEFRLGWQF